MSIYKITTICLIIGSGILIACSSNTNEISNKQQSTEISVISQPQALGLHAYKDPVTGEFLDEPIENPNTTVVDNDLVTTVAVPKIEYSEPKISAVPGGGVYIELVTPPLQQQAINY